MISLHSTGWMLLAAVLPGLAPQSFCEDTLKIGGEIFELEPFFKIYLKMATEAQLKLINSQRPD